MCVALRPESVCCIRSICYGCANRPDPATTSCCCADCPAAQAGGDAFLYAGGAGAMERVWEDVGGRGRRRQRLEKDATSDLPQKKEVGMSLAFKRRTFGLCFRCLALDHFVVECHGSIWCLGCGQYGHRERDCKARHAPSPRIHSHEPPRPPGRPSRVSACQAPLPCNSPPPAH
jgi:hypothetical protein